MADVFAHWKTDYLHIAVAILYERDRHLVTQGLERAASARIACHLERTLEATEFFKTFPDMRVDVDYGREADGPKRNSEGKYVIPDIIIHKPGKAGPNLTAVEIKGCWNNADRALDEAKLRNYLVQQGYGYAYSVELSLEGPTVRQIQGPERRAK